MNLGPCLFEGCMSDLYFIQIEPGPVKIGRASNIKMRLSAIQCASPYKAKLIASIPGGGELESEFHRHLRNCHIRGEWFRWTNIVAEIAELINSGGDWMERLCWFSEPPVPDDDEWRRESPLYANHPG